MIENYIENDDRSGTDVLILIIIMGRIRIRLFRQQRRLPRRCRTHEGPAFAHGNGLEVIMTMIMKMRIKNGNDIDEDTEKIIRER